MRKGSLWMMSIPLTVSLMLLGCSQAPEDTIEMVTSSFKELKAMKAKDYTPEAFQEAEDAYEEAMAEIEAQREKSVFTRSYLRAKNLLDKASQAVEQATSKAEVRREEEQQEAAALLEGAKVAFKSAEERLAKVKTRSSRTAQIRDTFEESGGILKEAEKAFDSGDFLAAHSKAIDAKALTDEVLADIGETGGR